jgi:signal transduction histidine kinase
MNCNRNVIFSATQTVAILALVTATVGRVTWARAEETDSEVLKQVAVVAVHTAAAGLGAVLKDVTDTEAQLKIIRAFIEPVRFFADKSGYFYVYNFDCVNVAHATQKDLVGKNLFDHKDSRGKLDIQALAAAAKQGGGFVEYYWVKPGKTGEFKKLGYVEPIPGTSYFIGTGIYLP